MRGTSPDPSKGGVGGGGGRLFVNNFLYAVF